tara:strand:+ start:224 stop:406 length:183 start_codon:yes stop_codon:yes gene_type:complete
MGKNRVQRKTKENNKPKKDNIYTQKHIRIALMKQEKHFEKMGVNNPKNNFYLCYNINGKK